MLTFTHRRGRRGGAAALCGVLLIGLASVAWRRATRPAAWAAADVPVAFWAWRDELPEGAAVERAAREARARVLFVRAGQLHSEGGRLSRVRAPRGQFPRALPVHLVYNATRGLLGSLEATDAGALSSAVAETFAEDSRRAARDGARVEGVQLDLDVPTRLLPSYAALLRALRPRLPGGAQLSVTGLPTWMGSHALAGVLAEVDFWVPQFYGSRIPERLEESAPVSSVAEVAEGVSRARALGRPFYAGLADYGYAALYTRAGALVELRGDIDPARVASDPNFELVERRAFDPSPAPEASAASPGDEDAAALPRGADASQTTVTGAGLTSHWRYVFRARFDTSFDGLQVRAGEHLLLDAPSAESLRAAVRAVRERAGPRLLGLCLFRLPGPDDATTLTLAQIAAALADRPAATDTRVRLVAAAPAEEASTGGEVMADDETTRVGGTAGGGARVGVVSAERLIVAAENAGAGGALLGEALSLTVGVPAGSVRGVVSLEGFTNVETLCGAGATGGTHAPCGARRADVLRFTAPAWQPGARARAVLSVGGPVPARLPVEARVRADDGRTVLTISRPAVERRARLVSGGEDETGSGSRERR